MFGRRRTGPIEGTSRPATGSSRQARSQPAAGVCGGASPARPRRVGRDRHGRGVRGPLALPGPHAARPAPVSSSFAERFDDLVLDVVEDLESRLGDRLGGVEFAVEDVPEIGPAGFVIGSGSTEPLDRVPLGSARPGDREHRPRVVVYRRPLEARTVDSVELAVVLHWVVVEQIAELFGVSPAEVDPQYGEDTP